MTLINLRCNDESSEKIRDYLRSNGISGKKEFHSTLLYSEVVPCYNRFEIREKIESRLPLILDPNTYFFNIFTPDCLVLCYENSNFRSLKDILNKEQSTQYIEGPRTFQELMILKTHSTHRKSPFFISPPHITIAKNYKGNIEDLPDFDESLVLSELIWRHQEHL